MKNIHLIPTDKPSRLILQDTELYLSKYMEENEGFSEFNQHIYITSDEEIKKGDLKVDEYYLYFNKVRQFNKIDKLNRAWKDYKKIILTTDQNLINDGVQAISDTFLEWFVKNPSCEFVELQQEILKLVHNPNYVNHTSESDGIYLTPINEDLQYGETVLKDNIIDYKIVIPQEEHKQETLEEAAERLFKEFQIENPIVPNNNIRPFKLGFIKSAKWQAERMYSEAIEFAEWIRIKDFQTTSKNNWIGLDMKYYTTQELFEQFKKK
jgi:hypothetical protein